MTNIDVECPFFMYNNVLSHKYQSNQGKFGEGNSHPLFLNATLISCFSLYSSFIKNCNWRSL